MQQLERDLDLIEVILRDASVLSARVERFGLDKEKFVCAGPRMASSPTMPS